MRLVVYIIYHNPRCSKSRKTLEILTEKGVDIKVIEYLKDGVTTDEVLELSSKLSMPVQNFVRKKEEEALSLDIDWNEDVQVAEAISKYPKILERPIVVKGSVAVVNRPLDQIEKLF